VAKKRNRGSLHYAALRSKIIARRGRRWGKRTADPSASLGMTKGRAALTSAAVTEGWTEPQVIRNFHHLGWAEAMATPVPRRAGAGEMTKGAGGASVETGCWTNDRGLSIPMTNAEVRNRCKICHPERSRGICSSLHQHRILREAAPSPLSSRPELSVVERSAVSFPSSPESALRSVSGAPDRYGSAGSA
jgi:hypothetical protein